MAKLVKSHNKNTDKRTMLLAGVLFCIAAAAVLAWLRLWLYAALALCVCACAAIILHGRFKILQSGLDGENKTAKMLAKSLPRGYYVMQNFTVKCGPTAELDCAVVSPKGVIAVEVKNYAGHITGTADGAYWRQTRSGKNGSVIEKQVSNPIKQSERQAAVLDNVLKKCGVRGSARACVYFCNSYITADVKGASVYTDEAALLRFITGGRASLAPKTVQDIVKEIKHCSL